MEAEEKELLRRISETGMTVALLGASGEGLEERRSIARRLSGEEITGVIPEDDFSLDISPSLAEQALFSREGFDLIFVNVQSWGSAVEFAQLVGNEEVVSKLRVLVD